MKHMTNSTLSLILMTASCASIRQEFPNGKVISQKECQLGKEKVIASVIQKDLKTRSPGMNPLEAVVHFQNSNKSPFILSKQIENSKGIDRDFLLDFWNEGTKTATAVDIRCTVPNKDPDISTTANGEFKAGFNNQSGPHLCYQASTVYNNWACFHLNNKGEIQSSFVQMNAD